MRDLHCHILPGVDDGARTLDESLDMLRAAHGVGIDAITCTPHCRDPYFDYMGMWRSFWELERAARDELPDLHLQMGFEVNHRKLCEVGLSWAEKLHFDGSNELLLEFSTVASPTRFGDYERTIFALQGEGLRVIIAHPERYQAIQNDISLAEELVHMGCKLQVSTTFLTQGRFSKIRSCALRLIKRGLVSYMASDAHNVRHYACFERAHNRWSELLTS